MKKNHKNELAVSGRGKWTPPAMPVPVHSALDNYTNWPNHANQMDLVRKSDSAMLLNC